MLSVYERRARLTPGLLAVAPVVFTIAGLGLKQIPVVAILSSVLVAAGGTYALAVLVGHLGRRAQVGLRREWGGAHTLLFLRTRTEGINETRRDLWRTAVSRYTGVQLLTEAEEEERPDRADEAIVTAVGQCLELGHGGEKGKPAVVWESAQYGFERNVYGSRWFGRTVSLLMIVLLVVALVSPMNESVSWVVAALVIDSGLLLLWIFMPSKSRTEEASTRYATQLFNAVAVEARSL